MTEQAWLEWRRGGLGASDVAGVLGLSPWTSPWALWASKTGLLPDFDGENEMMIFGKRFEAIASVWFHDETGLTVAGEQTWCTHRTESWARATVDGFVFGIEDYANQEQSIDDALGTFEVKVDFRHTPEEWAEMIPVQYQCQGQWQMYVTDTQRTWFAVLHNWGRFRVYELARNDEDIALLVDAARTFWHDFVLAGVAPPVDGSDATADAIKAAWPDHDPGSTIEADDELRALIVNRVAFKAVADAAKERLDEATNALTAAIGANETVTAGGVPILTYRAQSRATVDAKALAASLLFVLRLAGYDGPALDPTPYTTTTTFRKLNMKGTK